MEILLEIREEMSREADYDVDLFTEIIRSGKTHDGKKVYDLNDANTTEKRRKQPLN